MTGKLNSLSARIKRNCRKIRTRIIRKQLKNKDFTIICNNCTGAMVMHDFGQRLDTPTVNLFITPKEYIQFLSDFEHYIKCDTIENVTIDTNYPVGLLDGKIHLNFMHYRTFDEAVEAWNRRKQRIHYDNLFIILVVRDGCTHEELKAFDKLPFKHKIALVNKPYQDIKNQYVIEGYEKEKELGLITEYSNLFGKRVYDEFDWVQFLNQ